MTYMVSGIEEKKITSFFDLVAWQVGHEIVLDIYRLTKNFPKEEQFGLTSQMRRCAVSVTSNIAEGFSRNTRNDKNQFYATSLGSLTELQNQLKISLDIDYINQKTFAQEIAKTTRLAKLIQGLIKTSASRNTKYQIPNTIYGEKS